jgi:hypothetical protein
MEPWFIATEPFRPGHPQWARFIEWSGLSQLKEVVFDPILCPPVLPEIKAEYWPHIVNEDFMLQFFVNYDFFREQIAGIPAKNVLCVVRNPDGQPALPASLGSFTFLGFDVVDVQSSASALTNCGGFPDVFDNTELSPHGLLMSHARALEVKARLHEKHPHEPHGECHVWAIFRADNHTGGES